MATSGIQLGHTPALPHYPLISLLVPPSLPAVSAPSTEQTADRSRGVHCSGA